MTINIGLKKLGLIYKGRNRILSIHKGDNLIYEAPASILLEAEGSGTIVIQNQWSEPIVVDNLTTGVSIDVAGRTSSTNRSASLQVSTGDSLRVMEGNPNSTFRHWALEGRVDPSNGVASYSGTPTAFVNGVPARITYLPPMNRFTVDKEGTTAGENFFAWFCSTARNGNTEYCRSTLTSVPDGSFDTSGITTVGDGFFFNFNSGYGGSQYGGPYYGSLTSLPAGSFDISNITTVGAGFFSMFNATGGITSLPSGSFVLNSNLTTVGPGFLAGFNGGKRDYNNYSEGQYGGKISSIPAGVFNTSNITTAGRNFLAYILDLSSDVTSLPNGFLDTSGLTSIPSGAFGQALRSCSKLESLPNNFLNTSNATSGDLTNFMSYTFSGCTKLTALPEHCGDVRSIQSPTGGGNFLSYACNGCTSLTSLPDGFGYSSNISQWSGNFNYAMRGCTSMTSLPDGFGDCRLATSLGARTFAETLSGCTSLTSLPDNFLNTSNVVRTNDYFVLYQTLNGCSALTSLPANFLNTSSLTTVGGSYNLGGIFSGCSGLTSLPANCLNTSNLTTISSTNAQVFYNMFRGCTSLVSLPEHCMDTTSITSPLRNYFASSTFYNCTSLTSLPDNCLSISHISGSISDTAVFATTFYFCSSLTTLPAGCLDTRGLTSITTGVFERVLEGTHILSYPAGVLDFTNVTTLSANPLSGTFESAIIDTLPANFGNFDSSITHAPNGLFFNIFKNATINSVPSGVLDTSNITSVGDTFAQGMFYGATIYAFPADFTIANITTAGDYFLYETFSRIWLYTQIPLSYVDTSSLTTVGINAFLRFTGRERKNTEYSPKVVLPQGAFDFTSLTSVGDNFARYFNDYNGYGAIMKSTTSYNPDMINPTNSDISVGYRGSESNAGNTYATVSPGQPFYFETT